MGALAEEQGGKNQGETKRIKISAARTGRGVGKYRDVLSQSGGKKKTGALRPQVRAKGRENSNAQRNIGTKGKWTVQAQNPWNKKKKDEEVGMSEK